MTKSSNSDPNLTPIGLKTRPLPLSFRSLQDYMLGRVSPFRALASLVIADLMPTMSGEIIEIGATRSSNCERYANPGSNYILSNISGQEGLLYLDAMDISLPDDSVDSFVCIAVLEHLQDPWQAISEIHRTLKPGGKLLLIVPFMFPYHEAPGDFFRFSDKALAAMCRQFEVTHAEALGNVFSTLSLFLQRPFGWFFRYSRDQVRASLSRSANRPGRIAQIVLKLFALVILRMVGVGFYLLSFFIPAPDAYACGYCLALKKPEA